MNQKRYDPFTDSFIIQDEEGNVQLQYRANSDAEIKKKDLQKEIARIDELSVRSDACDQKFEDLEERINVLRGIAFKLLEEANKKEAYSNWKNKKGEGF